MKTIILLFLSVNCYALALQSRFTYDEGRQELVETVRREITRKESPDIVNYIRDVRDNLLAGKVDYKFERAIKIAKITTEINYETYILQKAFDFAKARHGNQLDKSGKVYFYSHLVHTFNILKSACPSDVNLLCAGYLHDIIEDTETTYCELVYEFGEDIANLVAEVTYSGSKDKNGQYNFPRLKTERGMQLKFADTMSQMTRLTPFSQEKKNQFLEHIKFWKSESYEDILTSS